MTEASAAMPIVEHEPLSITAAALQRQALPESTRGRLTGYAHRQQPAGS